MTRKEKREMKRDQKKLGFKIALFPRFAIPEEVLAELLRKNFDLSKPFIFERDSRSGFCRFMQGPVKSKMRVYVERAFFRIAKYANKVKGKFSRPTPDEVQIDRETLDRLSRESREQLVEDANLVLSDLLSSAEQKSQTNRNFEVTPLAPTLIDELREIFKKRTDPEEKSQVEFLINELERKESMRITDLSALERVRSSPPELAKEVGEKIGKKVNKKKGKS